MSSTDKRQENSIPEPLQSGHHGWPWREERSDSRACLQSVSWPKISLVTPSFNQGRYLEETIRSVLQQSYPNLEYIVIDGGSSDNSVEIIKHYSSRLDYWSSGPDRGQMHAINTGFSLCRGDILGWLNSDDVLLPGALERIGVAMQSAKHPDIVIGERLNIDSCGNFISHQALTSWPVTRWQVLYMGRWPFYQESVYFRRALWNKAGPLSEDLQLVFDFDFFLRCLRNTQAKTLPGWVIGCWRHHADQKISPKRTQELKAEIDHVLNSHRSIRLPSALMGLLWSIGKRTVWRNDTVQPITGNLQDITSINLARSDRAPRGAAIP